MSTRAEPSVPLGNKPNKTNWVEKYHALPKGSWIRRAAEHIKAKGRPDSEAIPFAVNAARRICRSGDTNLPGLQQVAPAKRADACAALAIWDAAAARAKAAKDLSADEFRAIDLAGARLARGLDLTDQQREVIDLAPQLVRAGRIAAARIARRQVRNRARRAVDLAFNPDEARSPIGRWVKIGAGGAAPPSVAHKLALGPTLRGRSILGGFNDTIDQHSIGHDVLGKDGKVVGHRRRLVDAEADAKKLGGKVITRWTRSRAKLHAEVLRKFLDGNFEENADGSFTWHRAPHSSQEHPVLTSTAGGPASGKSRMLAANPELTPEDAVVINPDVVKAQLPEYAKLLKTRDPFAAAAVHEESSYLAAALTRVVAEGRYNAVLDVVGDSGEGKFVGKLRAFQRAGYRVRVAYATVPTRVALKRAEGREQRSGRHVDSKILQDGHRDASKRFREVVQENWIDHVEVWDTSGNAPQLIATAGKGKKPNVTDRSKYDAFLAKGGQKGYL